MDKVLRIGLILITIVLSFYGLSFGDELAKGLSPMGSSDEPVHGQGLLHEKKEASFSSPEKEALGSSLYGANSSKTIGNPEFSINPEITNTIQSPGTTEIQKGDLSRFEGSQLSMWKSSYHFGKIHLMKNNLDRTLTFISSLSMTQYERENPISGVVENLTGLDILKSMAILLELKLYF